MKVAYVAGPYDANSTYDIVQNIRRAEVVALSLWKMGYAVICPHKNSSLLDNEECPREIWINGYLEILRRCDLLVVIPNWEDSAGTRDEISLAGMSDIPTFYWPDDLQKLKSFI